MDAPKFPRTVPQVNINGTSVEELVAQRRSIMRHLRKAMLLLAEAAPHGRDFQTVERECYKEARELYEARWTTLSEIHDDLYAEAIAIQEQGE